MKEIENVVGRSNISSKDNLDKKGHLLSTTSAPLSEMVWSQNKGPRVQYVASSLSEKKASVLWNTESFNIVISSPKCSNRESSISNESSSNLMRTKSNSESSDKQSSGPSPTDLHTKLVSPLNASSSKYAGNVKYLKSSKGKEPVIYDVEEDRESASKEIEDSQDSIGSCSSKRLTLATSKRPRTSEYNSCRETKRLKKHAYNRTESSFMNWVSSITNGFIKATPLSYAPPPSSEIEEDINYYSLSNEVEKDTGFKSIFKSLYLPNINAKKVNVNNSLQVISNEVAMPMEGIQNSSSKNLISNSKNDFLHNSWVTRFSPRVSETVEKRDNNLEDMELKDSKYQEWLKMRNQKMKCEPDHMFASNATSSFAKRLENWQISTKYPKVSGNVSLTLTTCLFCGKSSHGMKACK